MIDLYNVLIQDMFAFIHFQNWVGENTLNMVRSTFYIFTY